MTQRPVALSRRGTEMEAFTFAVTTQVDIPIRIKMYVLHFW